MSKGRTSIQRNSQKSKPKALRNEFVRDFHNFANKWPTSKVAEALGLTRQALYQQAKNTKPIVEEEGI